MPQRADKMTGGPSGKKRGPGDLRHPAGAQHARLKRENTAKLPKGVTGVVAGGKPGTFTEGGKKKTVITQKQMDALHAAKRSVEAEADRKKKPSKRKDKDRSPTDAEREAVGEGRAMFNKRGRKALREESIGTKLRSFGRSLKRKVTGRKASRNSGR